MGAPKNYTAEDVRNFFRKASEEAAADEAARAAREEEYRKANAPKTREQLLAIVNEQIANVDSIYNANKGKWESERKRDTPVFGGGMAHSSQFYKAATSKEKKQLEAAQLELENARKALDTYTESDQKRDIAAGKEKSWHRELRDGFKNMNINEIADIVTFDMHSAGNKAKINMAMEKRSRGEEISEIEQAMIDALGATRQSEQYVASNGGGTVWNSIGSGLRQSVGFMVRTALTGGSLGITRELIKQGAGKAALTMIGREALRSPVYSMASDFQDKTADQYTINADGSVKMDNATSTVERLWKSYVTSLTEGVSEQVGTFIPIGFAGKGLRKVAPKLLGSKIGGAVEKGVDYAAHKTKGLRETLKKTTNYNGTIDEYFEEQFNNVVEPLLTGEPERIADNFSAKQQWITLGSVAIMGSAIHSASIPGIAKDEIRSGNLRGKQNKAIKSIENEAMRQGVYDAIKKGVTVEDRAKMISSLDWGNATRQDVANAVDAYSWSTQLDLLRGFNEAEQTQELAARKVALYNDTFTQGKNEQTGMLHEVGDNDGNRYFLLNGSLDEATPDGTVFVRNMATGQAEQKSSTLLYPTSEPITYEQGLEHLSDQMAEQVSDETNEREMAEADQDAIDSNVAPVSYNLGDQVQLSDGRTARFIAHAEDGTMSARVAFIDPETGDQETTDIPRSQIMGLATQEEDGDVQIEDASSPSTDQIIEVQGTSEQVQASEVATRREVPLRKDGQPDYDMMPADMFLEEYSKVVPREDALADLRDLHVDLQKSIKSIQSSKVTSLNKKADNRAKLTQLQAKVSEIAAVLEANSVQTEQSPLAVQASQTESQNDETPPKTNNNGDNKNSTGGTSIVQDDNQAGQHQSQGDGDHSGRSPQTNDSRSQGEERQNEQITDPIFEATTPEEKYQTVSSHVDQLNELSGADAIAFSKLEQLPDAVAFEFEAQWRAEPTRETPGVTIGTKVYIYAPHIKDTADLEMVFNHEIAAHRNVLLALGKDRKAEAELYSAVVDGVGVSKMLQVIGDPDFEDIADQYFEDPTASKKTELGKEFVGYFTNKNFDKYMYSRTGKGKLLLNLSEGITVEDVINIINTANRKGDEQRIIIENSRDRFGRTAREAGDTRNMGQDRARRTLDTSGRGSDNVLASEDTAGDLSGISKNTAHPKDRAGSSTESKSDSEREIRRDDVRGAGGVEQANSTTDAPRETVNNTDNELHVPQIILSSIRTGEVLGSTEDIRNTYPEIIDPIGRSRRAGGGEREYERDRSEAVPEIDSARTPDAGLAKGESEPSLDGQDTASQGIAREGSVMVEPPAEITTEMPHVRFGQNNTIVTADRIEELLKIAKQKLMQLNSGFDPELFAVFTELSAGYIEAGVRKFSDFTTRMVEALGEKVRPYLASMYEGARRFPGMENISRDMDSTIYVDNYISDNKTPQDNEDRTTPIRDSGTSDPDGAVVPNVAGRKRVGATSPTLPIGESERVPERESGHAVRSEARVDGGENESTIGRDDSTSNDVPVKRRGKLRLGQPTDGGSAIGDEKPHQLLRPRERNRRNFRIDDTSAELAPKGEIAKINANIKAITLLKKLRGFSMDATKEEKATLAQYSGWGGLASVLDRNKELNAAWEVKYKKYHDKLRELLTPEEFTAAVNSTINAHYTTPQIISSIWQAVEGLGFKGGAVMEPAVGTGNFFGAIPQEISDNSKLIGYELDPITGGIAQLLYPDANIKIAGYETSNERNGSLDLVISNVPFGKTAPYDARNKDISSFSLHNYFIAKGIRQLKDGGLGVFVTSSSTMDGRSSLALRKWTETTGNADFLGAIRLPNTAFKANAGTDVTTDIIFYRKRNGLAVDFNKRKYEDLTTIREVAHGKQWNSKTRNHEDIIVPMKINEYFAQNPHMMLGEMKFAFETGRGGLYSDTDQTLQANKEADLHSNLAQAIKQLPQDIYGAERTTIDEQLMALQNDQGDIVSTYVKRDGKSYEVGDDGLIPITGNVTIKGKKVEKATIVADFVDIKQGAKELVRLEQTATDDAQVAQIRKQLSRAYDSFVKKYGTLNKNTTINFLQDDIQHTIPYSLENINTYYEKSKSGRDVKKHDITKADILSRRVNHPIEVPSHAESSQEAIRLSIRHKGNLDVDFMAGLLSIDAQAVETELTESGLAFIDPASGRLEQRSEYLSGYVKDKLEIAQQYAKEDARFESNVRELQGVIPSDITPSDVNFRLGSYWIPPQYIEQFYMEQFGVRTTANYVEALGEWVIGGGWSSKDGMVRGYRSSELATKQLNARQVIVYDKVGDRNVKNIEATAEVAAKMSEINDSFIEYIQSREDDLLDIAKIFNAKFNNYVSRIYDSESGLFLGANPQIKLRPHQINAVQRILNDSVLMAHEVGTGKTFTMITGAMEMRRLGIARKPMIVVQNSTLEQFSASFQQLYPSARLLVPSEKQRSATGRQRLFAMMAYGDFDAVIIPQSFIDFIEDNPERVAVKLQKELDLINEIHDNTKDYALRKELSKQRKKLEAELEKNSTPKVKDIARKQLSAEKKFKQKADRRTDKTFTFEELGVDALFVDEAHAYKKLGFNTNMGNVKGIDTGVSKRAFSMKMKTDWVQERTGGRNVVFATGTPITNTMAEAWTMMRFISPDILKRYGIENFDAFASTFGVVETSFEFNAAGNFKQVERFKSFMNAPEFIRIFKSKTDVVLSKDIPGFAEQLPKLKEGAFTNVIVKRSHQLIDLMEMIKQELVQWAKQPSKERNQAVPLVMFTRASQAAIDLRLVDPDATDDPMSKANAVVKNAKQIYDDTASYNGTQMIFVDRYLSPDYTTIADNYSVYKNPQTSKRFNLYEDMKDKLVTMGVPEGEIAIVSEMDAKRKEQLFEKMNNGDVRIVLGSTERMGVGVNAQRLMAAVHHVDAPARPMDFTQRNGRIIRQGNTHAQMGKDIQVFTYGVEKTLDVTAYQRLAFKQAFIEQILRGDIDSRVIDDAADEGSISGQSFEEMMGSLSGSQYALRLTDLKAQLRKAEMGSKNYERSRSELRTQINYLSSRIAPLQMTVERKQSACNAAQLLFPDGKVSSVNIMGVRHFEKLGDALNKLFEEFAQKYTKNRNTDPLRIGINDNPSSVIVLYDPHNEKYSYIMRIAEDEIKGECTTGSGLLTSIASRVKNLYADATHAQIELRDVQGALPSFEKRLNEPNKSADKVELLKSEIDIVTKLIADESKVEEDRIASELERESQKTDVRLRASGSDDEMASIKADAIAKDQFLKAPNGEPTKLTERQWLQVRTSAFKEWFGDWEKVARIEKLRKAESVEITGNEIEPSEDLKQYKRNALEYGKSLRGEYINKDTGETITISRASLTEVLSHSISDDGHIQSIAAIPQIIENSIYIDTVLNEDPTVNKDVSSYDYYVCGLNIGGVDYTVKAVVVNAGLGVRYYDHKLTQIEKGKLISVSPVIHKSGSDLNLPKKSDYSNRSDIKDKRLISILQNSASKVVDANGEPMVVYHGTDAVFALSQNELADKNTLMAEQDSPDIRYDEIQSLDNTVKEIEAQHAHEKSKATRYVNQVERRKEAEAQLQKLAQKFNSHVTIVASKRELPENLRYASRDRQFSGLYHKQTGAVYFVMDEIRDADEATATFLHEVVSHRGIDGLLGKANAEKFYQAVFDSLPRKEQNAMLAMAGGDKIAGGDEFVARMAEGNVTPSIMHRVVAAVRRFFREVLGMPLTISDNDIRYILWKSKNNLERANSVSEVFSTISDDRAIRKQIYRPDEPLLDKIEDMAVRYRSKDKPKSANHRVSGFKNTLTSNAVQVQEVLQDSTIKVHLLQKDIEKGGGAITPEINVYESLNHLDSRAKAKMDRYDRQFITPFVENLVKLDKKGIQYAEVSDYMSAKHSIERHESGINAMSEEQDGKWTMEVTTTIVEDFEKRLSKQELDGFWNMWRKATDEILKTAELSGRMSAAQAEKIRSRGWQYYVPLRGKDWNFEEVVNMQESFYYDYSGYAKGKSTDKKVVNIRAKGRTTKADDPIAALQNMAHTEIYLSELNNVNLKLLRLARKYPERTDLFAVKDQWFARVGQDEWHLMEDKPSKEMIESSNEARKAKYRAETALEKATTAAERAKFEREIETAEGAIMVKQDVPQEGYTGAIPKAHDVVVMKDGKKYVVELKDPEVAAAINQRSGSVQRWLSKWPGRVTRVMSQLATSKNPLFVIPNFIRDIQHAMMYNLVDSDGDAVAFFAYAMTSWKVLDRSIRGVANPLTQSEQGSLNILDKTDRKRLVSQYSQEQVQDTLYELFYINGGETGYVHILDPVDYQRKLRKASKRSASKLSVENALPKGFKALNDGVDYLANISENITRFATFMSQIDKGSTVFDAVSYAKNITVNFNRKGKYSKGLGSLFMFFNAGIQGAVNTYSLWGNKKDKSAKVMATQRAKLVGALAVLAATGFVMTMLLHDMLSAMIGDDEEEFTVSDYERRTNLIIPTGNGTYMKIPIPILFRPFYSLGVQAHDWMIGRTDGQDVAWSFAGGIADAMLPVQVDVSINPERDGWQGYKAFIPSPVKPLWEIGYNQNFAGRPINKESKYTPPGTPDSQMGMPYSASWAKWISETLNKIGGGNQFTPAGVDEHGKADIRNWLDISPSSLEHIATSYTGGVGKMINDISKMLTGQDGGKTKIPIANRFYGKAYEKDPSREYYDLKSAIERVRRNNKLAREQGSSSAWFSPEELNGKTIEGEIHYNQLRQNEKRIKNIRERMQEIGTNSTEYQDLDKLINRLQRQFTKQINDQRN